jgi:hypothetical protein
MAFGFRAVAVPFSPDVAGRPSPWSLAWSTWSWPGVEFKPGELVSVARIERGRLLAIQGRCICQDAIEVD